MTIPSEITLPDGRVFTLQEIDPGDMLDLIEAAGSAMNSDSSGAWLGYAQSLATVVEIDGVPVPFPKTKAEIKALGKKIGNAGFVAVQKALFPEGEGASDKDVAKN